MSFNFNLSSDFFTQTQSAQSAQLKILAISKKNSSWYLDNDVSFHVSDEKDKFMNLQKVTESSATTPMRADLNTDLIETLRIQVDNQILMLHDFHYSLNTVTNLIFFEMLEWQEFEIEKIRRSDDLCLFKITDLEDQVFTANQSDINIYSIQRKISDVLTAVSHFMYLMKKISSQIYKKSQKVL